MSTDYSVETREAVIEILGNPVRHSIEKVSNRLDALAQDFIRSSPLVIVSTVDNNGKMDVSPKGDAPGFCHIENDRTLLLPERKGNKLAFGFDNIIQTHRIGMLFLMPGVRETMRVNGSAEITNDPKLLEQLSAQGKPALLCTRIHVEECFIHCGKALIRSNAWQPDTWKAADVSFGRMYQDRAIEKGKTEAEAAQIKEETNRTVEELYKEDLY